MVRKCISCGEWGTLEEVEEAPVGKQAKVEVGAASYVDISTLESSTILSSVSESSFPLALRSWTGF